MMDPDLIVLSLATTFNAVLSGFILIRNPKGRVNQVFGLFGLVIVLWTVANFAADHASAYNLFYTRLTLFLGAWLGTSLFMLCSLFPNRKRWHRSWYVFYGFSLVTMLLSFTPLYVGSVTATSQGAQLEVGPLYALYDVYILLAIVWSVVTLLRGAHPANRNEKSQVRLVATGIIIYASFAFLSNGVLPLIIDSWSPSRFGPIFTIPFVGIIAYAIFKHRLFDMRLAITRTIGFMLTVGLVSALYSLLVLGIGVPLIANGRIGFVRNELQLLLFLPPTLAAALTFPMLQHAIARLTENIFYQDSYDTRAMLDKLSDALISDNDLKPIMASGLAVLCEALKPAHALFVVLDEQGNLYRHKLFNRSEPTSIDTLIEAAKSMKQHVLVKDEQPLGKWQQALEREGVALVLRLGTPKNVTGIIFFGPKQNGRIYTKQDIDLLGVSAKNFGIAIENAKKYQQIARFADTMRAEVLRATASLRRANTKLKTLDAMKDDFISMASHQLRSPAASVHDAIKMLEQSYLTAAERKKITELADASSERLLNVVTDMLSVARIQAGHFTIERAEVDMEELVDRALLQASALVAEKHITVHFERPPKAPIIMADRAKMNESMANYIENAVRYSPEKTQVNVSLFEAAGKLYFEVTDHGIGVPRAERKDLFSKFYRATNARKEHPNGNGIGLFVVKTVVEAHGGAVYYKPQPEGSLFGFWLPSE